MLLYELQHGDGDAWIECHVRGGVHDESARSVLKDVGDQLHELVTDRKYGFPGLGLIGSEEETVFASQLEC